MNVEPNLWGIPGLLLVVLAWSMSLFILFVAPGRAANRRLAMVLALEGMLGFSGGVIFFLTGQAEAFAFAALGHVAIIVLPFVYPLFLGAALDTPLVRPFRGKAAFYTLSAAALVALGIGLARTDLLVDVYDPPFARWNSRAPPLTRFAFQAYGVLGLYGLAAAISAFRRAPRGTAARERARAFALAFGLRDAFIACVLTLFSVLRPIPFWGDFVYNPLFMLVYVAYALILAYGMLRSHLFDIDLRIKWTIQRGTLVGAFIAVFFVISQMAQNFLNAEYGLMLGGVAAGLLLFAIKPLERIADRAADRAMPGTAQTAEYLAYRKLEVYRAALEGALQDGEVTPKEREVLRRLRASLGISEMDAAALERDLLPRAG